MIDFWVLSALLVVLALGFIVYPFLKRQKQGSVLDRRSQNIAAFKDRLAELEAEKQAGNLAEEQFQQLKTELEASLITDVDGLEHDGLSSQAHKTRSSGAWVAVGVMAIFVPLISYSLYMEWGALDGVEQYREWGNAVPAIDNGMPEGDIEDLLATLRDKLEKNPDNADGWFMLARSSMNLEKYDQASYAFLRMAEVLENQQEDPSAIYGLAAQALFFAQGAQMTDKVKGILDKAFATNPDETNGLGLLGIDAYQTGRYEDAIKYWSRILEVQPDNPSRDAIIAGINKSRVALGLPVQDAKRSELARSNAPVSDAQTDSALNTDVKVLVELDPSLAGKVSANDVVFIVAKAVNGSPMPLAASRQTVADLPILVTLNDSMAMGPMAKISSVKEVTIVARISKSGQPSAQKGDLEGVISPVGVGMGKVVNVLISQEVK